MSADSERLDRLEAIVAKALNIDFSEFDTPSQAKDRAKAMKEAEEMQAKQLVTEQKQAGVTAAEDRIASEEAAGKKKEDQHPSVQQLTAGPRHLLTDGTTGGPQTSDTGKPKDPEKTAEPLTDEQKSGQTASTTTTKKKKG
jgi:hypothetical protein